MNLNEFQQIAPTLPHQPGVYKYFSSGNELLYVGKAKDLRKRVSSYFNKTLQTYKTHELVLRIARIEFTVVNSEQDALLLENALIKEFQPRFNIDLKDDKSFPYIVLKNEHFPRVFLTRSKHEDGAEYLGPFTSVAKVRELLTFVKQTIQLRNCSLNLAPRNIEKGKYKVCLEYHLGNCKGPCEGLQTEEDYSEGLDQLRNILKGNLSPVIQHFKTEMNEQVSALAFEKAEQVRKKIEFLENFQSRSVVVNARLGDLDVFALHREENSAYTHYLMVRNGTIVQTHSNRLDAKLEESPEELLEFAITHYRSTFNSLAPEIIVPLQVDYPEEGLRITVPKLGEKKKLLDLATKNVAYFLAQQQQKQRLKLTSPDADLRPILEQMQRDLHLPALPVHIECFDNSNFQGSYPVSAMVCFRDGRPSKKDYRHFNIKTVTGINDFASMKETVFRRYRRLKEEGQDLPQLVIIDGGKGQLSAAMEAIAELDLRHALTVVGLAKNEEELFFPDDRESLKLDYSSDSLKLIRRIRDEVHRFGITFHRNKRSKGTFKNELETIPGIGKQTAASLLKTFRSVKNIREKSVEELKEVVTGRQAEAIKKHFSS